VQPRARADCPREYPAPELRNYLAVRGAGPIRMGGSLHVGREMVVRPVDCACRRLLECGGSTARQKTVAKYVERFRAEGVEGLRAAP
jgi:hypothetical protein